MQILIGVDPLADEATTWNPYRYGFNNPIKMIDSDGLFETEVEAKEYAKLNGIKTGWFRSHKISQQDDGTYAITKGGHIIHYFGTGSNDGGGITAQTIPIYFNKYIHDDWEMIYNPTTKEVWHMQPMK